jgi:renalase
MNQHVSADVIVIGAGITGLTAANVVARSGASVIVLDQGHDIGGRMASHSLKLDSGASVTVDHGAQFFTAKGLRFRNEVAGWLRAGHVKRWFRTASSRDPATRFCGVPSMRAVPDYLARALDVRLGQCVVSIRREAGGWVVANDAGATLSSPHLIVTAPLPQALALMHGVIAPESEWARASRGDNPVFAPCVTGVFVLNGPSGLSFPGGAHIRESLVNWVCDNSIKGVSGNVHVVTAHAVPAFSSRWWTESQQALGDELTLDVERRVDSKIVQSVFHGWRHSLALCTLPGVCGVVHDKSSLVLAGDAFVSPKVEGAFESGTEAGLFVVSRLR